jgi:hypothetical protein
MPSVRAPRSSVRARGRGRAARGQAASRSRHRSRKPLWASKGRVGGTCSELRRTTGRADVHAPEARAAVPRRCAPRSGPVQGPVRAMRKFAGWLRRVQPAGRPRTGAAAPRGARRVLVLRVRGRLRTGGTCAACGETASRAGASDEEAGDSGPPCHAPILQSGRCSACGTPVSVAHVEGRWQFGHATGVPCHSVATEESACAQCGASLTLN